MNHKIAMLQILVVPADLDGNLERALDAIKTASTNGASCAVLPECFDLGWADAEALQYADTKRVLHTLQNAAMKHNIHIASGVTEQAGDEFYNASVFISSDGQILGKHRKINLVNGVEDCYQKGTSVSAFDTPLGKIGLTICADNLSNSIHLAESLHAMGVKLILSPSSWAVPPEKLNMPYGQEWYEPYEYVYTKYGIEIIGVSNVGKVVNGPWKDWICIGNSIAISNKTNQFYTLPYGENATHIGYIEIENRNTMKINS